MKLKVLIIMDHSYNKYDYVNFLKCILNLYGDLYELKFRFLDSLLFRYNYIPEKILEAVDIEVKNALDEDFKCVIVDGPIAYFWLRSFYDGDIIVINPIIDIYNDIHYNICKLSELSLAREILTKNVICVLSKDFRDNHENFDNVFYNTTVILSDYKISDINKFWGTSSALGRIFKYIINK